MVGLALGYGRKAATFRVAYNVGVNAYQFLNISNNTIQHAVPTVTVAKTEETHRFAATLIHHTIMGREEAILREVSLKEFKEKDKEAFNPSAMMITHTGKKHVSEVDLWNARKIKSPVGINH